MKTNSPTITAKTYSLETLEERTDLELPKSHYQKIAWQFPGKSTCTAVLFGLPQSSASAKSLYPAVVCNYLTLRLPTAVITVGVNKIIKKF